MSSIRSPPINRDSNPPSRLASFSGIGDSISQNTNKASEYIFNALTPKSSLLSSPGSSLIPTPTPNPTATNDAGDDSPSFFNYFIRFILVIVLLTFAGFNIFAQMGIITEDAMKFIEPVIRPIMKVLGMAVTQTIDTASEGTKTGVDIVSGATKSGVNVVDDQLFGSGIRPSGGGDAKQERARANALTMKTGADNAIISPPEADDASSVTQKGKVSGKAGYCLVGEDRGIRSCVKVGEGDTCMSGNIFPSKDVCINPSLRV